MTSEDETAERSHTEKLADLVARRKAEASNHRDGGRPGRRSSERSAAAASASKSKPAPRKG